MCLELEFCYLYSRRKSNDSNLPKKLLLLKLNLYIPGKFAKQKKRNEHRRMTVTLLVNTRKGILTKPKRCKNYIFFTSRFNNILIWLPHWFKVKQWLSDMVLMVYSVLAIHWWYYCSSCMIWHWGKLKFFTNWRFCCHFKAINNDNSKCES